MIKREKKNVDASLWSRRSDIFIYTNETNRSKLSSRKFPWNQYLLIFEGKLEEVALEKLELVEQPIPRASIRQFVNLIPSRTRSWRVANLVSKTGGGGGGGWGKKKERIFFSIFFFLSPAEIHFRLSSEREGQSAPTTHQCKRKYLLEGGISNWNPWKVVQDIGYLRILPVYNIRLLSSSFLFSYKMNRIIPRRRIIIRGNNFFRFIFHFIEMKEK